LPQPAKIRLTEIITAPDATLAAGPFISSVLLPFIFDPFLHPEIFDIADHVVSR
jgi:hypothetical protein